MGMVNAYLVSEDDGLTVIDTTIGGSEGRIIAAAEASGAPIVRILLTHAHGDHVGSLDALKERLPDAEVIVSTRDTRLLAKDMSLERLPDAIRGVVEGEVALPRRHAQHLLEELRGRDILRVRVAARTNAALTDREWEVLQLLGERASTAEMSQRLRISQVTVRRHVSTLLGKLGVGDRESAAELIRRSVD